MSDESSTRGLAGTGHSSLITHHSPQQTLSPLRTPLLWSAAGAGVVQLIQFGVGIWLVRLLRPETFGLLALAMVVIGSASVFTEAGLGPALVQRVTLTPRLLSTVFWSGLA